MGEGLQRERLRGCSELTFLDTGSNRCHGIIFKLVRKPKSSLFFSSFFLASAIFRCQLYREKPNSVCSCQAIDTCDLAKGSPFAVWEPVIGINGPGTKGLEQCLGLRRPWSSPPAGLGSLPELGRPIPMIPGPLAGFQARCCLLPPQQDRKFRKSSFLPQVTLQVPRPLWKRPAWDQGAGCLWE